jgi:hypothetical protein
MIRCRALFETLPPDWVSLLETHFPTLHPLGTMSLWRGTLEGAPCTLAVLDTPMDADDIQDAALGDLMETHDGLAYAQALPQHAILTLEDTTWAARTRLLDLAKIFSPEVLIWDDGAYINRLTMEAIALGAMEETYALYSVAGWADDEGALGFYAPGLSYLLGKPFLCPSLGWPTSKPYRDSLHRFACASAWLAQLPPPLPSLLTLPDPLETLPGLGVRETPTYWTLYPLQAS